MVSYTNVQDTPATYNGSTTLQSHDPLTAAQPNRAPQLKVNPGKQIHNITVKRREKNESKVSMK